MKLKLSSKQTSKLAITPQLQSAIKLLQMTAIEINQEIQNIFECNPLIEKEDACENYEEDNCEIHYSHYQDNIFKDHYNTVSTSEIIEKTSSEEDTLQKYLFWQTQLLSISDKDKSLAETIIDYINEDGYLIKEIFDIFDEIYHESDITIDELIAVQHLLQNLDPVGTCTNGIQESLLVQIQNISPRSEITNKAYLVINEFFEEYTEKKFNIIKKKFKY